jgi:hypothetical protein
MNLHEHQAKAVLKTFGAPVAEGLQDGFRLMFVDIHKGASREEMKRTDGQIGPAL